MTKKIIFFLCAILIFSSLQAQQNQSPVKLNGQLKIEGTRLLNENDAAIQLKGMSLFWSQWQPQYYNYETIKNLKEDWGINVVRAAMGIEHEGFLKNPEQEKQKVYRVIDAAIELGLYVIVDWHDHNAENHLDEAKRFFKETAKKYANHPNIIYELYNEPLDVSWNEVLKPYHTEIIKEIRKFDKNNIIVCGTPNWSQDVDLAAKNPIKEDNIAYTLHFYAGTHQKELMLKAEKAIKAGLPIFVTEFGTTEANGDGKVYKENTQKWFDFMDRYNISWCNWSIADKDEASAALKPDSLPKDIGKKESWSESGAFIRTILTTTDH